MRIFSILSLAFILAGGSGVAQAQPSGVPCEIEGGVQGLTFGDTCQEADTEALFIGLEGPRSLQGLGAFEALDTLYVSAAAIGNDFTGLSEMTALEELHIRELSSFRVQNLEEISALANLHTLEIQAFGEHDFTEWGDMLALKRLKIGQPVQHGAPIGFFAGFSLPAFPSLETLRLDFALMNNPDVLEDYRSLTEFEVAADTPVQVEQGARLPRVTQAFVGVGGFYSEQIIDGLHDFDPAVDLYLFSWQNNYRLHPSHMENLAGLENVVSVKIWLDPSPVDLSVFDGERLEHFRLSQRGGELQPVSLSPLAGHPSLHTVNLGGFEILDLDQLRVLAELQTISVFESHIADFADLSGFASVESISIRRSSWGEMNSWSGLDNLRDLWIEQEGGMDLGFLPSDLNLEEFSLDIEVVDDLSPLAGMTIEQLMFWRTEALDLAGIGDVNGLQELSLFPSDTVDLKPLLDLPDSVVVTLPYSLNGRRNGPFGTFRAEIEALP